MFCLWKLLRSQTPQVLPLKSVNRRTFSLKAARPGKKALVLVSSAGVGAGLALSWMLLKQEPVERKFPLVPSLLPSDFLPSVFAATSADDVEEDEDINKGDPKSKAREIRSLNMRKDHNFIADVVERTAPAVVFIEIKDSTKRNYFGAPATISNGSGFIVKEDGLILTNAHVVVSRPYARVQVKLYDGRVFEGYVEDVDMKQDLATVRIPCTNLPVLRLGSSATVRPGEWVVAMGSPLSLSNTITVGVISSISRGSEELGIRGKQMEYIQTDAAITFGNSGGPLVNLDGEAVGINSMKVTAGISFAIPIDYGKAFLKAAEARKASEGTSGWLDRKKKLELEAPKRRYIGVTMLTLTPQLIQELQMRGSELASDVTHGVLIWKVVIGSPAFNGGLQPGDVITSANGKQVVLAEDVYKALENTGKLHLEVSRKRDKLQLTIAPESS